MEAVGTRTACRLTPQRYPDQPDDVDRMKRLMARRPGANYRDLVRALPKRQPERWRLAYGAIKEIHPYFAAATDPTRPTDPTSPTPDEPVLPKRPAEPDAEALSREPVGR